MDNFDLRKYLVENKVTTNSKILNEDVQKSIEAEIAKAAKMYRGDEDDDITEEEAMMLAAEDIYDKYRERGDENKAEIARAILRSYENR